MRDPMAERLQLARPGAGFTPLRQHATPAAPITPPPRRRPGRGRQVITALALGGAGASLLAALMLIPERLDALLLVSTAIANVIGGLSRLGLGLLQLTGVLVVALLALLALLLLLGGMVRLARALAQPQTSPSGINRGAVAARTRPVARRTTER